MTLTLLTQTTAIADERVEALTRETMTTLNQLTTLAAVIAQATRRHDESKAEHKDELEEVCCSRQRAELELQQQGRVLSFEEDVEFGLGLHVNAQNIYSLVIFEIFSPSLFLFIRSSPIIIHIVYYSFQFNKPHHEQSLSECGQPTLISSPLSLLTVDQAIRNT